MSDILIVGYGNIGRHIYKEFEKLSPDIYDPFIETYGVVKDKLYDFAFVCVPTEMLADGSADTSIVEKAIKDTNSKVIIIKSAVPVGIADFLMEKYKKNIVVSPEYYGTTQHSEESPNFLILGGDRYLCDKVAQLYYLVKNGSFRIRFTDLKTAELAKYMENCFLALKVTFCSEFFEVAKAMGISYSELREIFIMDERMGESHTLVYSDKPYYDSHCLNKDIPAFIHFTNKLEIETPLISSVNKININKKSAASSRFLPRPEASVLH